MHTHQRCEQEITFKAIKGCCLPGWGGQVKAKPSLWLPVLSLLWCNLSCTYIILCTCKYLPHFSLFQFPAGFTMGKYWQSLVAFSSFPKLSWQIFIKKTTDYMKKKLNGWNEHKHRVTNGFIDYLLNVVISVEHPHGIKVNSLNPPTTADPVPFTPVLNTASTFPKDRDSAFHSKEAQMILWWVQAWFCCRFCMSWDKMLPLNTFICISGKKRSSFFFCSDLFLSSESDNHIKYEVKVPDMGPFGVNIVTVKEHACINAQSYTHKYFSVVSWRKRNPY